MIKYLPLLLLGACTSPEFITLKDKQGNHIHAVSQDSFFNSPNSTSEWSFWYFLILAGLLWLVWKEFKSVKFPKSKDDK
jgi:hypothetical protein